VFLIIKFAQFFSTDNQSQVETKSGHQPQKPSDFKRHRFNNEKSGYSGSRRVHEALPIVRVNGAHGDEWLH
jgi:hypothetical protein